MLLGTQGKAEELMANFERQPEACLQDQLSLSVRKMYSRMMDEVVRLQLIKLELRTAF